MDEYGEADSQGRLDLPFMQVWESFLPKLEYRYVLREGSFYNCPHTKGTEVERVLILISQDGYSSAGICLDCLMDWVERNRSRIWKESDGS